MIASKAGHEDVVRCLVLCKADVNFSNDNAETALMLATSNEHSGIVELLCQNKAEVNYKSTRRCPQTVRIRMSHPYNPNVHRKPNNEGGEIFSNYAVPVHLHFNQPIRNVTIKKCRYCSFAQVTNVAVDGGVINSTMELETQNETFTDTASDDA